MINRALMSQSKIRIIVENLNIFLACVQLLIIPIAMLINVGLALKLFGVGDHTLGLIWLLSAALVIYVGWRGGLLPVLPDPRQQVSYRIGHWLIFLGFCCRLLAWGLLYLSNKYFDMAAFETQIAHVIALLSISIGVFLIWISRWTGNMAALREAQEKIQYQSIETLFPLGSVVLKFLRHVLLGMVFGMLISGLMSLTLIIFEFILPDQENRLYGIIIVCSYFLLFIPGFLLGIDVMYLEGQLPHLLYAMPWAVLAREDFSPVIAFCIGITINGCIVGGCIACAKQLYRLTPSFRGWIVVKGMRNGAIVGFLATRWITVECGYLSFFCEWLRSVFLIPSALLGIDTLHGPQPNLIYALPWSLMAQGALSPASAFCMGVTINASIVGACLALMKKAPRVVQTTGKIPPR